jgi:hypothetical protein
MAQAGMTRQAGLRRAMFKLPHAETIRYGGRAAHSGIRLPNGPDGVPLLADKPGVESQPIEAFRAFAKSL